MSDSTPDPAVTPEEAFFPVFGDAALTLEQLLMVLDERPDIADGMTSEQWQLVAEGTVHLLNRSRLLADILTQAPDADSAEVAAASEAIKAARQQLMTALRAGYGRA